MSDLCKYLTYFARSRKAHYFVCADAKPLETVVSGLAAMLPDPVRAFHFEGDYLLPGEGVRLLEPLLKGETVILVCYGQTSLSSRFSKIWHRYGKGEAGFAVVARNFDFTLNRSKSNEPRGVLVVLQMNGDLPELIGLYARKLDEDWLEQIEEASGQTSIPIIRLKARKRRTEPRVTIKDLCLLHLRDGNTPLSIETSTVDRAVPVTWTDLQQMLRAKGSRLEADLENLQQRGLLDQEKWAYYLAACDYLDEYKGSGSLVRADIYHVVWLHEFLERAGTVFRGQGHIHWRLDTTLFRDKPDGTPLDIDTLYNRLQLTNGFLAELDKRQRDFFGAQLQDNELLAIAQHYGFPSPLLDFTRSFRVAAFFASLDARKLKDSDQQIGVIYCLKPMHSELRLDNEENLEAALGIENFRLIRETGIRLGKWLYIEPDIADEDNRIARQKGVFIEGYQVRDLRQVAVERIYFYQHPGEVFEDRAARITEEILLPDRSQVNELAKEVKGRFKSSAPSRMQTELGRTLVPATSIIGSSGAELYVQLEDGQHFFQKLKSLISLSDNSNLLPYLDNIFQDYFRGIRSLADIGDLPTPGHGEYTLTPIAVAITRLEEATGIEKSHLWNLLDEFIPGPDKGGQTIYRPEVSRTPGNERERIALACALYVVGWQHLFTVNGWKARGFAQKALEVLYSEGDAGPIGI